MAVLDTGIWTPVFKGSECFLSWSSVGAVWFLCPFSDRSMGKGMMGKACDHNHLNFVSWPDLTSWLLLPTFVSGEPAPGNLPCSAWLLLTEQASHEECWGHQVAPKFPC